MQQASDADLCVVCGCSLVYLRRWSEAVPAVISEAALADARNRVVAVHDATGLH